MITPSYAQALARYNAHMNRAVVECSDRLPSEQRDQDRGAFFGSISGTLQHILWADGIWMARFQGQSSPVGSFGHQVAETWESFKQQRLAMDQRIDRWAEGLSQAWLDAEFEWTGVSGGHHKKAAWLLVTHLFNHSTHHRGQATTLLSQLGVDVGTTDLPLVL